MDDRPLLVQRNVAGSVDGDSEHDFACRRIKRAGAFATDHLASLEEQEHLVAGGGVDQPGRTCSDRKRESFRIRRRRPIRAEIDVERVDEADRSDVGRQVRFVHDQLRLFRRLDRH